MLTTLCVCLTVLVVLERVRPLVVRLVAVHEHRYTPAPVPQTPVVEIPRDVQQAALQWADPFAQEAYLAKAQELYAEHEDWDTVRTALQEIA